MHNKHDAVEYLLEWNPSEPSKALDYARAFKHVEIVDLLLKHMKEKEDVR
jgi:hypothetical protein